MLGFSVPLHPADDDEYSLFSVDNTSQPHTTVPWDKRSNYGPTPGNFGGTPPTEYSFTEISLQQSRWP